jgi:hypothetical protein
MYQIVALTQDALDGEAPQPGGPSKRTVREPRQSTVGLQAALPHSPAVRRAAAQQQRSLTNPERAALVRAYETGAMIKDLAAEYGIHRTTAAEIIERAGVPKRRRGLDNAQVEHAIDRYANGLSLARVGQELGVDSTT